MNKILEVASDVSLNHLKSQFKIFLYLKLDKKNEKV
jgi:hypothetical protein